MIVDTHTHPYLDEYMPDTAASVIRAIDSGVGMLIMPNVSLSTIEPMKRLHNAFPRHTAMAMGLHPTEINASWHDELSAIEAELFSATKYVAVGEIGIDLYWDKTFRDQQLEVLDIQFDWASKLALPVIIHCRDGLDEVIDVMKSRPGRLPKMVFHSFGGDTDDIKRIRMLNDAYFGINGIVTFKNSHLRDYLPAIGIDRLLLETDAPYLAPVPHRGKRNESAYIVNTATHIAESMQLPLHTVCDKTTENAREFFNLTIESSII